MSIQGLIGDLQAPNANGTSPSAGAYASLDPVGVQSMKRFGLLHVHHMYKTAQLLVMRLLDKK